MKVILAGHTGTKHILPATSFLIKKYMDGFDVRFLNFGDYAGTLYTGRYERLDSEQRGGAHAWSRYIREYLQSIPDDMVILALDDYLLSGYLNDHVYDEMMATMLAYPDMISGRMCDSSFYPDTTPVSSEIFLITNKPAYTATTQYTIWRRKPLIEILKQTTTPWDFEEAGSRIFNKSTGKVAGSITPILPYPVESALSERWAGKVNVAGNKKDDIEMLISLGHLTRESLC